MILTLISYIWPCEHAYFALEGRSSQNGDSKVYKTFASENPKYCMRKDTLDAVLNVAD